MKCSVLFSVALTLAACGSSSHAPHHVVVPMQPAIVEQYLVDIDALSESDNTGKSFVVKSGRDDISENDLRFREFARIVGNALRMRGFVEADSLDKADQVVSLRYGVGDSRLITQEFLFPVYGRNGAVQGTNKAEPSDTPAPQSYAATTYSPQLTPATMYTRWVFIQAEDAKTYGGAREGRETRDAKGTAKAADRRLVWETRVASTGASGDLRRAFPAMMFVAYPYLGMSSGEIREHYLALQENDPRLHPLLAYAPATPAAPAAPVAETPAAPAAVEQPAPAVAAPVAPATKPAKPEAVKTAPSKPAATKPAPVPAKPAKPAKK